LFRNLGTKVRVLLQYLGVLLLKSYVLKQVKKSLFVLKNKEAFFVNLYHLTIFLAAARLLANKRQMYIQCCDKYTQKSINRFFKAVDAFYVPIVACELQTRADILIDKGANVYLSP
jgi:hypothetical protein